MNDSHILPVTPLKIFQTWWPLAASWLLMAFEGPMVNAIIARLANPEINLAGFGSVSEPLRSLTTAPLLMLLSASVALVQDWKSYLKIRRFMWTASGVMTAVHFLLAFTPLYFVVVRGLLGIPEEVLGVARIGLMICIPLPWAIGYRRFQQGIMIRYGYSNVVVTGTFVRLSTVTVVMLTGYAIGSLSGVVVGSASLTAGMVAEALFCGWRVRPILRSIPKEEAVHQELSWKAFFAFYLPLVLTSLLSMIWRPIGSAAISRMPDAISSLAVWPGISGLLFLFQTLGISYNEVVVALLDKPGAYRNLRNFAMVLFLSISVLFILVVATPLSDVWFITISALPDCLVPLAQKAVWFMLPIPGAAVLLSWFQGSILYSHKTRGITEAVVIFLASILIVLAAGIAYNQVQGVYVGAIGFTAAMLFQMGWLWFRAWPTLQTIRRQEQAAAA